MSRLALTAALALAVTACGQQDPAQAQLGIAETAPVAATSFELDYSHTVVRASWGHQDYSRQSLEFTDFGGTIDLDLETPPNSVIDLTFNLVDGLWAGAHHERFIGHLNSDDFFETELNPTAHFVATSYVTEDHQTGIMTGDLTMNGQTHPVSLDVTLNKAGETRDGATKLGFTATGTLLRSQWDMGYGIPFITDEIELFISTEMVAIVAEEPEE